MSVAEGFPAPLAWTGERMVPHQSDGATELFHWQRYLYFRSWYEDRIVVDAASGEGYGTAYAAAFAKNAVGYDLSTEAIEHASRRYPQATFVAGDVCEVDYSAADVVISFETIEHLPDPGAFLNQLSRCTGSFAISTPNRNNHSPGNSLEDKPWNPYHSIEWSPQEFADLIREHFPTRQIRFLSQENRWPGLIRLGLDPDAKYVIAVVGDLPLPQWPKIGLAMPTLNQTELAVQAVLSLTKFYPGELELAIVANGTDERNLSRLRELRDELPHAVHLLELPENVGYGRGANIGLHRLRTLGGFDCYGVVNDDVIPSAACMSEMASTLVELKELGHRPGMVGPVSNAVSGLQQVNIGAYTDAVTMMRLAENFHLRQAQSVTEIPQVRGLLFLMVPEALDEVGGFDPIFGTGNFEDDDLNIRLRLAGYTLWKADGAFLHHYGSSTFKQLETSYERIIERNLETLLHKWDAPSLDLAIARPNAPAGVGLHVPLDSEPMSSGHRVRIEGEIVDLIHTATDVEFVGWVHHVLAQRPRSDRMAVLELLNKLGA